MIIEKKKLFKWVGGKKWIKDPLIDIVNNQVEGNRKIDTYIEPCVGGLGSFLAIANTLVSRGIKNVYLNDINEVLISTFRDLQKNNRSLYDEYIRIEKEYESRICNVPSNTTLLLERVYIDLYDKPTEINLDFSPYIDFNSLINIDDNVKFIKTLIVLVVFSYLFMHFANIIVAFLSRSSSTTNLN